jgi:hypothetical protein
MTCRSGSASLTPSAAPAPQPSPAAELDPKKLPARVEGQCSGNSVYSLTIADSGSRASARQALTQTGLIGCIARASPRCFFQPACIASRPCAIRCRRAAIAASAISGASAAPSRGKTSRVAPVIAASQVKPRTG